jgi:hypothetical protein
VRAAPAALLGAALVLAVPGPARAQWTVTPWLGLGFDGTANFVTFEDGIGETKVTFGGAVGWLTDGLLGLEGNVGYTPGALDRDGVAPVDDLILDSSLLVATGDLLVLTPRAIVRDTLRPYVVGGLGLMRVHARFVLDATGLDNNYLALAVGGGAIGRLTERSSLRFEVRRLSNLSESDHELLLYDDRSRVSFWRLAIGVQVAY